MDIILFKEENNKRKIAHCKYIRLIQRKLDHILGGFLDVDSIEIIKKFCMFKYESIPRSLIIDDENKLNND